jgi:hypothetical protein
MLDETGKRWHPKISRNHDPSTMASYATRLITRRSKVQILPAQPTLYTTSLVLLEGAPFPRIGAFVFLGFEVEPRVA